eukprot:15477554-Alexandrium_andersonii.AAC.1
MLQSASDVVLRHAGGWVGVPMRESGSVNEAVGVARCQQRVVAAYGWQNRRPAARGGDQAGLGGLGML